MRLIFISTLLRICGIFVKAQLQDDVGLMLAGRLASDADPSESPVSFARKAEKPQILHRDAPSKRIIKGLLEVRQGCNGGDFTCAGVVAFCCPIGAECCAYGCCDAGTFCTPTACCYTGQTACIDGGCCDPGTFCATTSDGFPVCCIEGENCAGVTVFVTGSTSTGSFITPTGSTKTASSQATTTRTAKTTFPPATTTKSDSSSVVQATIISSPIPSSGLWATQVNATSDLIDYSGTWKSNSSSCNATTIVKTCAIDEGKCSFEFTFRAIAVYMIAPLSSSGTIYKIECDDDSVTLDSYNAASLAPICGYTYSKTGLDPSEEHSLTVEVLKPSKQRTGSKGIFELNGFTLVQSEESSESSATSGPAGSIWMLIVTIVTSIYYVSS